MRSFKDATGRAWTVGITVADMRRVRALVSVDLYALVDDGLKGLSELLSDPCRFVDVLYVLAQPADGPKPSDEEFGRSFDGDALEAAADAFAGALTDFFPKRQRTALEKVLAKSREVGEKVRQRGEKELEAVDPEAVAEKVVAALRAGSPSSPSGPASSVAPPDP